MVLHMKRFKKGKKAVEGAQQECHPVAKLQIKLGTIFAIKNSVYVKCRSQNTLKT